MDIVFASGNRHKAEEISQLFKGHRVMLPQDLGIAFDCEETEPTFLGNSLLKARALWETVRRPVLADDSGICVDALGGAPGVISARYGSQNGVLLGTPERNAYLLRQMEDKADRACRFVCCMVLLLDAHRFFVAEETLEGRLIEREVGSGGFGYDPVVFLPDFGKTVAELTPKEKNRVSHRGKAASAILSMLNGMTRT